MPLRKVDTINRLRCRPAVPMSFGHCDAESLEIVCISAQIVGSCQRTVPRQEGGIGMLVRKFSNRANHSWNRRSALRLVHKGVVAIKNQVSGRNDVLLRQIYPQVACRMRSWR